MGLEASCLGLWVTEQASNNLPQRPWPLRGNEAVDEK